MTNLVTLGIISALLSLFLDFCMRDGHIFAWWLDFWAEVMRPKKVVYPKGVNRRDYLFSQITNPFFKPLGYCVVCQNVWVSFAVGVAGCFTWNMPLIYVIFVVILSSFIVRLTHERLL